MEALHGGSSRILSFFNCSSSFLSKLWSTKLYSKINMVLNTCCFWGVQVFFILHSEVQFVLHYLLRWCYVIFDNYIVFYGSQVVRNEIFKPIIFSLFKISFQPSTSLLELSCVIFHLKPSLRNVAIVVIINDPSYLSIILVEEIFHLVGVIDYITCFRSGRILPQFWEAFHKPTTSLFVSLLVFQQPCYNLLGRVLSKLICGRSWHFLLHSVIPMIYLLFFLPEALWCCSLHSSSRFEDRALSMLIHLTGVLCLSFLF